MKEETDHLYMQRALELASRGLGAVSSNPMVGCVIVHENQIIGEGWHQKYGEAHAEVNAIASVQDQSKIQESDIYVTLEPCAHHGKTPPCADLLVKHQPKRVIICNTDSNPLVSGKGIQKLKEAGIEVVTGCLEQKGRFLNRRFFTFMEKKRPYIVLKWAQTADGFIARANYDSKWISNELSRKIVHRWRAEEDALMVGTNTAKYDNPQLNVRDWTGRNPVRIVIDRTLQLEKNLKVFDQSQRTIVYNLLLSKIEKDIEYVQLGKDVFLNNIMADLYEKKIQSLIVEGGSHLLQSLIDLDLWDEARIFYSPAVFGEGIKAPHLGGLVITNRHIKEDKLEIRINF